MDKTILVALVSIVVLALGVTGLYFLDNNRDAGQSSSLQTQTEQQDQTGQDVEVSADECLGEDCLKVDDLEYPAGELPRGVVDALNSAIEDEYKARATYEAVMAELGSVRPFSMIIRAEEKHISSLKSIYDKYGVKIPKDTNKDIEVAKTLAENCSVGVQAEIDNASLYRDKLLPAVADYPDITSVFTNLMNASQDNHLPAFQRCAS